MCIRDRSSSEKCPFPNNREYDQCTLCLAKLVIFFRLEKYTRLINIATQFGKDIPISFGMPFPLTSFHWMLRNWNCTQLLQHCKQIGQSVFTDNFTIFQLINVHGSHLDRFPVAGIPINGQVCVPLIVKRIMTLSPSAINSSAFHWTSGIVPHIMLSTAIYPSNPRKGSEDVGV